MFASCLTRSTLPTNLVELIKAINHFMPAPWFLDTAVSLAELPMNTQKLQFSRLSWPLILRDCSSELVTNTQRLQF